MKTSRFYLEIIVLLTFFLLSIGDGTLLRAQTSRVEFRALVINELMFNPVVGGAEYVELFNRSGHPVAVASLAFALRSADGEIDKRYSLASIDAVIPPQGYLVCTKDRGELLRHFPLADSSVIYGVKMPALRNRGVALLLLRMDDQLVVDEVYYQPSWHDGLIKKTKGVALERIDPEGESADGTNWSSALSSVGYGTPGAANSLLAGDDEGAAAWIELPEYLPERSAFRLVYRSERVGCRCQISIFTIDGVKVATIANNLRLGLSGELAWDGCGLDGRPLPAALYLFYGELYHAEGVVKRIKRPFLIKRR